MSQKFSQLAQIFAPASGTGVPPVCFWSATAPTFAAIHGGETARATTFWLRLRRAEPLRCAHPQVAPGKFRQLCSRQQHVFVGASECGGL